MGSLEPDLTQWMFWWEFNKEPYLELRARIQEGESVSGVDGFYQGHGQAVRPKANLAPTEPQIRQHIVPALLAALEKETHNDIVTGCLIALARIGDVPSETGTSELEPVLAAFLPDKNQEISETAAIALGILGSSGGLSKLEELMKDTVAGRALVGQSEVSYRTRAFAAYGLGLIGSKTSREETRQRIVRDLRLALENDDTKTRDLSVSCLIAMGLVPLETISSTASPEKKGALVPAESSRIAQLDFLLAFLRDDRHDFLVRAHCPTALARLLPGLSQAESVVQRERVANELLECMGPRPKEASAVIQSAVLALSLIGTNDDANPLDRRIRDALLAVPENVSDQQARNFALIALAKCAGQTAAGAADAEGGIERTAKALLLQLAEGKGVRPWAGLACGILARELAKSDRHAARIAALQDGVRSALKNAKDPELLSAFAISSGIMGDIEAKDALIQLLTREKDDRVLGYAALGLGLMNAREAIDGINRIVAESRYRPERMKQAAVALGLLGDKDLVPKLIGLLQESSGLATQASLSAALGFIGDWRSIEPLVGMLQDDTLTASARGFAAVALGRVADKAALPWNSAFSVDLNYRAATSTLTNQQSGILDIL